MEVKLGSCEENKTRLYITDGVEELVAQKVKTTNYRLGPYVTTVITTSSTRRTCTTYTCYKDEFEKT